MSSSSDALIDSKVCVTFFALVFARDLDIWKVMHMSASYKLDRWAQNIATLQILIFQVVLRHSHTFPPDMC